MKWGRELFFLPVSDRGDIFGDMNCDFDNYICFVFFWDS